ncbi:hypothetical protein [Acrocarpospora corrugata]|uniref:hypothetical protein n=1 Tax=Acrocarpospora corrugata TaxID=35763 RepID=UPI0031E26211
MSAPGPRRATGTLNAIGLRRAATLDAITLAPHQAAGALNVSAPGPHRNLRRPG